MKNMMKEYLGNQYTTNHLRNFCLYWMKALSGRGDAWRKENDLDCLYFDGDLRADTLMSAWTPVKWVADCLNREYGMKFYKIADDKADKFHYLRLLAEDRDAYLPPKHELVVLLDRFLELAELRGNYILLPDRAMNPERYNLYIRGKKIKLFDEVPATLYYLFEKEGLGKYFLDKDGKVDTKAVAEWIRREHLEMGFDGEEITKENILPLVSDLYPSDAKWLKDEAEIKEALTYMISFLERREKLFNKETDSEMLAMDIVAFLRKWGMWQDVQIFTGGKCYTDEHGELVIRNEKHPEKYLAGIIDNDCSGNTIREDLSNPERLLDMTFEGPFSLLLRHHEYEVRIGDVSDEVRHMLVPETEECQDEVTELMSEYLEGRRSWDPAEYDSYEEWLLFNSYPGEDWFITEENACRANENEFSSIEEYEDFLMRQAVERECIVEERLESYICSKRDWDSKVFYDTGRIADTIIKEFNNLLAKYGLRYELCFPWSLTTYRSLYRDRR